MGIKTTIIGAIIITTGLTNIQLVQRFDQFITNKYNQLKTEAQQITWNHPDHEDILNDNIIKIRSRISENGFNETKYEQLERSFHSYLFRAIQNQYSTKKTKENKKKVIDFNDEHYEDLINNTLLQEVHDKQAYHEKNDKTVRYLFKYLDKHYDQKKATLFKTYYLTNARTYKKLVDATGYNFYYVKDTIHLMKRDIRNNLKAFISDEELYNRI